MFFTRCRFNGTDLINRSFSSERILISDKGRYNSGNIQKTAICRAGQRDEKPGTANSAGRGQPDGETKTDETGKRKRRNRIPAGYFFGSTLCTRVKIRNLCGQNTAIGENATYHTEDGRALCGVPALLVGGGDRRGARTRPGGRRPAAKRTGAPGCRERRGCRKRRARKTHKGCRERRERRGRHVPQHGAGYDGHGAQGCGRHRVPGSGTPPRIRLPDGLRYGLP